MTSFFFKQVAGEDPVIENDRDNPRLFYIDKEGVSEVQWRVEGGYITKYEPQNLSIWVVWDSEAPRHRIYASGLNTSIHGGDSQGHGFDIHKDITLEN
jgi:hypothetical protein